jgi:hypothetical protein
MSEAPVPEVAVSRVRPSLGPALVVVALVLGITAAAAGLALAAGGSRGAGGASVGRIRGLALSARAATPIIRRIAEGGEPPPDVARALVVPAGSVVASARRPPPALNLYSASFGIDVPAPEGEVSTFFRRELAHDHWQVLAEDATPNGRGSKLFARIGSSDGYYWEVEVLVQPVASSFSTSLAGASAVTRASISLVELGDAD